MTTSSIRGIACAGVLGLALCPWLAHAQTPYDPYYPYYPSYGGPSTNPQFYLGLSLGAGIFPDRRGSTSGYLDSVYGPAASSSASNPLFSYGYQDQSGFAAKVYGGTWITPNVGVEVGYAWLGNLHWRQFSTNPSGSFAVDTDGSVQSHAFYEALMLGVDGYGMRYFVKGGAYEAATDLGANTFNENSFAASSASATVRNTGGLVGLGLSTTYGRALFRLEVEDFINVGNSSSPGPDIPPWRASVVLLTGGIAYRF